MPNGRGGVITVRASLIVLNYQGEEVLGDCVRSLLEASTDDDEIIVVDNGSTDGSLDLVEDHHRIHKIRLEENTYIFGLNVGLAQAQGEFVAFLNNDMTVEPDFVDACLAPFHGTRDVFAVCPRILQPSGDEQGSRTAGFWSRGLIFYRPLPHSGQVGDCFFAVGGQSFYERQKLLEIGSIDPLLWPMYHEDVELSYRAWQHGWRVLYQPEAVAHHLGGHSSKKVFTQRQLRSFVRQNEFLIVWKNVRDPDLLAQHLFFLPGRLVFAVAKGDLATVIGFWAALRRLPRALSARRASRRYVRLSDRDVLRRVSSIT